MNDKLPNDEHFPIRHTDLSALEGLPSPEAEHAFILQRSDLEYQQNGASSRFIGKFAGPVLSPVNIMLAHGINLASSCGMGAVARYVDAPMSWVIGLPIGCMLIGTALIIGAMCLLRTHPIRRENVAKGE